MSSANDHRQRGLACLIGLALVLGTVAAYWRVAHCDFIGFDDPFYVSGNPVVQQGLTWPGVVWAFQSVAAANWHPLTWLSHMLDCQLWGANAEMHHLTNVGLHGVNVLLLFLVLRRMTGALWRSAFVAAVFGWHPMHVESVAWIAERKDVLSAFFFMMTLLAYARYAEVQRLKSKVESQEAGGGSQNPESSIQHPASGIRLHVSRITHHASLFCLLSLLFFACGLMSKPMLVTLPFVLLLLDYWPLRRLSLPSLHHSTTPLLHSPRTPPLRLLREKLPFFALSAADCAATFWAQRSNEAVWSSYVAPLSMRLENAVTAYVTYAGKLFWPGEMVVLYPYPTFIPAWQVAGATALLAAITGVVLWQGRKQPYLAVGWFWFIGTLVPVIGLVQVGAQSLADRYTYLPYIGLAIMVAWGVPAIWSGVLERSGGDRGGSKRWKLQAGRAAGGFAGALALASCLAGTRAQCRFWQNTETLFRHAATVTGANEIARDMLGTVLSNQGKFEEAIRQYREALKLYPNYAKFPHILYCHLGRVYTLQGRVDEAIEALTQAVRLKPNYAAAHFNLGLALEAKGKPEKSADELKAAAALAPDDAVVQARLVDALIKAGKADEALRHCQALRQARPGDPAPCFTLARVCVALNRSEEAVVSLKEAIRLAPKAAVYCNQLAWIYATHPKAQLRNGAEAVRLAERACALTRRREAGFLDTLSAAYAEAGRFAEAIKTAQEERAVGLAAKDNEAVEAAAQKLELYQAGKPYRER